MFTVFLSDQLLKLNERNKQICEIVGFQCEAKQSFTNIILTVWSLCTEKYKPEVDNAYCILTEGLYFEVRTAKQLLLGLLTGRIYLFF